MAEQTYVFLVQRPSGRDFAWATTNPTPIAALEQLVDDELWEEPDRPGLWATLDRQTTVERFRPVPVGKVAEDRFWVGAEVSGAA